MTERRNESDVLRTMAAALGDADRPELREIGRAVRDGTLTFADAAASSGYRDVFADCSRQLGELSADEFFGGEELIPHDEEPAAGGDPDAAAENEPGEPESYLVPATPRRQRPR